METNTLTSCGGVLYRNNGNSEYEIYLCKHPKYGYALPKGGMKEGETIEQCALREVREETGYEVTVPKFYLGYLSYTMEKEGQMYDKTVHFFAFEITDQEKNELAIEIDEKILDGEWLNVDEAINLIPQATEKEKIALLVENLRKP